MLSNLQRLTGAISFAHVPAQNSENALLQKKNELCKIIKNGSAGNEKVYRDALDEIFVTAPEASRDEFFNDRDVQRRVLKSLLRQDRSMNTQDIRLQNALNGCRPALNKADVEALNQVLDSVVDPVVLKDCAEIAKRFQLRPIFLPMKYVVSGSGADVSGSDRARPVRSGQSAHFFDAIDAV